MADLLNPELEVELLIDLGQQIEKFLITNAGKYVIDRCDDEMETAVQDLRKHDANDAAGIRELQNRIYRAESIVDWFQEAVTAGHNAQQQISQPEE